MPALCMLWQNLAFSKRSLWADFVLCTLSTKRPAEAMCCFLVVLPHTSDAICTPALRGAQCLTTSQTVCGWSWCCCLSWGAVKMKPPRFSPKRGTHTGVHQQALAPSHTRTDTPEHQVVRSGGVCLAASHRRFVPMIVASSQARFLPRTTSTHTNNQNLFALPPHT